MENQELRNLVQENDRPANSKQIDHGIVSSVYSVVNNDPSFSDNLFPTSALFTQPRRHGSAHRW